MIARAMERGVPSADIGAALNLQVESVLRRFRLLEGISSEAAEMLKDTPCSMKVFDILRQMTAVRQIEAADLMIGQNNFTVMFARALRAATSENQLAAAKKGKGGGKPTPSGQQIARMERELAALQNPGEIGRGNLRYRQSAPDRSARIYRQAPCQQSGGPLAGYPSAGLSQRVSEDRRDRHARPDRRGAQRLNRKWGPGPDKRGDHGRSRTVGRIKHGGGDGGEPA